MKLFIKRLVTAALLLGTVFSLTGCDAVSFDEDGLTIEGSGMIPAITIDEHGYMTVDGEEVILPLEYEGNQVLISRYHQGPKVFHVTFYNIRVLDASGRLTHVYRSKMMVPCQRWFKECTGEMATLDTAAKHDDILNAIYPAAENYLMCDITMDLINGRIDQGLIDLLFISDIRAQFENKMHETASGAVVGAVTSFKNVSDYIGKFVDAGLKIYEADGLHEEMQDAVAGAAPYDPNDTEEERREKQRERNIQFASVFTLADEYGSKGFSFLHWLRSKEVSSMGTITPAYEGWEYERMYNEASKALYDAVLAALQEYTTEGHLLH